MKTEQVHMPRLVIASRTIYQLRREHEVGRAESSVWCFCGWGERMYQKAAAILLYTTQLKQMARCGIVESKICCLKESATWGGRGGLTYHHSNHHTTHLLTSDTIHQTGVGGNVSQSSNGLLRL